MMKYKTIILPLMQQRPEMVRRFGKDRQLLTILNYYAGQLRFAHEIWTEYLSQTKPGNPHNSREALEIAARNLDAHMPRESPRDETSFSLEDAVAFINTRTLPD